MDLVGFLELPFNMGFQKKIRRTQNHLGDGFRTKTSGSGPGLVFGSDMSRSFRVADDEEFSSVELLVQIKDVLKQIEEIPLQEPIELV